MHELSLTKNVLCTVIEQAEKNKAKKVIKVCLDVGEMRDVIDELMQKCFRYLAKNTIAERAELEITTIPFQVQCQHCNKVWRMEKKMLNEKLFCPQCRSEHLSPYSGLEFMIRNIVIE